MQKKDSTLLFKKIKTSWKKAFLRLISFGGFSSHNHVQLFHDGDSAFEAIINAITEAKESIYIETYTFAADKVGILIRDALLKAHERGVVVTVIYDHIGSAGLSGAFLAPLTKASIKVLAFNPIWPWRRKGPLLFRDHRKIIVVDEKIAFCGSMNISADYAGPVYGNDRFRDSTAKVIGPAVKDLLEIVLESMDEAEFAQKPDALDKRVTRIINKTFAKKMFFDRLLSPVDDLYLKVDHKGILIQVVRSNMRRNLRHIQRSMEAGTQRAVSYCYFTTPYFLPYERLRKALIHAKERGVDVRILTAGLSDVPLMRYASRHVYKSLLEKGVRIYEMTKKTLHAKLATIDGVYCSIGSYNLDHWSAQRNLEVNLSIIDQSISLDLKDQFEKDLMLSEEVNKTEFLARSRFRQFLCWLAYLVVRL